MNNRIVLFSKAKHEITAEWLASVVPVGNSVRPISLPGFAINDQADRYGISVQVLDEKRRRIAIDWLKNERARRPSKTLIAELESRPLAVELELVRGTSDTMHPVVRAVAKAVGAIVECDGELLDEDMTKLSGAYEMRPSGAPPYDPKGPVDFTSFTFEHFWTGWVDVPWLGGRTGVMVVCDVEPIPLTQRQVVERVVGLPMSTRASLETFLSENVKSIELRKPSDIWRHLSEPSFSVPEKPKPRACFDVSFECSWDPEHGITVRFDDHARPLRLGMQGDI